MIEIVYYSEVIDNWGRIESSTKPETLITILKDSKYFTDDMIMKDKEGKTYYIEDLIGKEVMVQGYEPFIVTE